MIDTIHSERTEVPILLPLNPAQFGPISRRLVIRTMLVWGLIFLFGLVLALGTETPALRAAGLSLMLPGGGFLYVAWPSLFIVSVVGMAVAVLLWWGLSAFFTIPLVWATSVVVSALLATGPRLWSAHSTVWEWAVPVVIVAGILSYIAPLLNGRLAHRRKVASIPEANEYLSSASIPPRSETPLEPNDFDRELLAWIYELALQPEEEFEGFDWGEQYHGGTCLRYQISFLGEALSAYAVNSLPNHLHIIEPAMARLIERMTDQRVWKYWQLENFLATGNTDPDPIIKDNVMLTGFYQSQISLYVAATGSTKFDEPGCLKFVWKDGRIFSYDHKSINEAIVDNLKKSKFGLYACEPKWIFTVCNTQAAQGVIGYDSVHGTDYWARVSARFKKGLVEEMMSADGAFRHIRTDFLGFSLNDGDGTGEYFTSGSHDFEDLSPDLHARGRALALRGVKEKMEALESKVVDDHLNFSFAPKRERATFIMSALSEWIPLITGAYAIGNDKVAEAAVKAVQRDCATGERFPKRPLTAGVQAIAISLWPRWARQLSMGQINLRGYEPPQGPILETAPWPEVIVTKARSDDGVNLDIVLDLYKGEPNFACDLEFSELKPNVEYRLHGDGIDQLVTADQQGRAAISIFVSNKLELRLAALDA